MPGKLGWSRIGSVQEVFHCKENVAVEIKLVMLLGKFGWERTPYSLIIYHTAETLTICIG